MYLKDILIIVLFATLANADTWEQVRGRTQSYAILFPHGAEKTDTVWGSRQ